MEGAEPLEVRNFMNILFISDIVGKQGRRVACEKTKELQAKYNFDFIIANGENASHGSGITLKAYDQLLESGIDAITGGNHSFRNQDIFSQMGEDNTKIIRPANYPTVSPGKGFLVLEKNGQKLLLINLMGRVFLNDNVNDPYFEIEKILNENKGIENILLDYHAEATSEKAVMGYFLDGRISALVGTHTHIQTADEQILPRGTGFITDVGMVGPLHSSLGVNYEDVLYRERTQLPVLFTLAEGEIVFCAVIIELDEGGKCKKIERIREIV